MERTAGQNRYDFKIGNYFASGVGILCTFFSSARRGTALTRISFVASVPPGVIASAFEIAVCWFLNVSIYLDIQQFDPMLFFIAFNFFAYNNCWAYIQPLICYPLFQWRFEKPFIRRFHNFTPVMAQKLLAIPTALKSIFRQTDYVKYLLDSRLKVNSLSEKPLIFSRKVEESTRWHFTVIY